MTTNEIFGLGFSNLTQTEKIRQVATELEAVVLARILGSLRATVPDGGLFEKSLSDDIFRSMFDEEIARAAAEQSPFGLADALTESFEDKFKIAKELTDTAFKQPSISSSGDSRRSWRV